MRLADHSELKSRSLVVCNRGSPVEEVCRVAGVRHQAISSTVIGRLIFETGGGARMARRAGIETIFTLFGNAPLVSTGLYRISGFAFSNILMPEVDFWQDLPPTKRLIKRLKDRLRIWLARRSHEIIVETDFLAKRARQGLFRDRIVHVVKMEPSAAVLELLAATSADRPPGGMRLLALTSPHPNKQLANMAPIMKRLKELRAANGDSPPEFLISFDSEHPQARDISAAFEASAADPPRFIGAVDPREVATLLREVDAIVNIARLESFSNNWVEAWAAGIPLISADADWARSSCGDAAIYINPDDPDAAARRIANVFSEPDCIALLRNAGLRKLSELSANGTKNNQYYRIICEAENQRRNPVS